MKWKKLLIAFLLFITLNLIAIWIFPSPAVVGNLLAPIDIPVLLTFVVMALINIISQFKKRKTTQINGHDPTGI